jgi:hypothetical protein
MTSSALPNMETLTAFDHSIRFSIPTHQRSTFDRVIAGLLPLERFLSLLLRVRLGCKGFRLGKGLRW